MGLFYNYKEGGKGISKEQTESESVWALYFLIFKRRLTKFIQLNLIMLVVAIVSAIAVILVMYAPVAKLGINFDVSENYTVSVDLWTLYVSPLPLVLLAPLWGGSLVVARRLSQREYAFVMSEYITGVKDNWKQFMLNAFVCYAVYVLLSFAYIYYSLNLSQGVLYYIMYVLVIFACVMFILSQFYIPLMIVSVKLSLRAMYKNAFILAVLGLIRNIFFILIIAVYAACYLYFAWFNGMALMIAIASIAIFSLALFVYSQAYICYPIVNKYIIEPFYKKDEDEKEISVENTEMIVDGDVVIDEKIFEEV
ncbi:MAG: hypothetical protein R3Y33_05115 [Clostridia bacterium]